MSAGVRVQRRCAFTAPSAALLHPPLTSSVPIPSNCSALLSQATGRPTGQALLSLAGGLALPQPPRPPTASLSSYYSSIGRQAGAGPLRQQGRAHTRGSLKSSRVGALAALAAPCCCLEALGAARGAPASPDARRRPPVRLRSSAARTCSAPGRPPSRQACCSSFRVHPHPFHGFRRCLKAKRAHCLATAPPAAMRLKGKGATSLLALRLGEPTGLVEEPAAGGAPAIVPYRLVPVAEAGPDPASPPAVLVASNARVRSPKPALVLQQPDFSQLEQIEALARQQQGAAPAASGEQQADAATAAAPTASAPTTASGRPQRKRKAPQFADDMIPTDLLSRRASRPRQAAAATQPPRPAGAALPVMLAAAGGAQGGLQLVTMNTPSGGTVTGLAVPATALLPALQQQLLRAHGATGAAPTPYKLVAPAGAAITSSSSDAATAAAPPPAVKEAAPRDIAQLARQLDEEERKKALAGGDARVTVRVLPGTQAGRSAKGGFAVPAPRPPGSRSGAGRGRAPSRQSRKPTPDIADQQLPQLPPHTWHPGFEAHGGVTVVSVAEAAAAPPLPAVVVGEAARTTLPVVVTDPQAQVCAGVG